jgi:putative DNA primase/helicase
MTDQIASFIDHMRANDCGPENPHDIIADDKRRRYRLAGDKVKTQNASYQLTVDGDGFAVGWVYSFKQAITHPWHSKSTRKATDEERAAWKAKSADAKKAREAESKRISEAAATKGRGIWSRADKTGTTPYLDGKGCDLNGARIWQGMIVVPMYGKGGLTGLQFIGRDGEKRFLTGSAKEGAYFPIANRGEAMNRILICEGFATACALRRATGLPVVAAFDAGNLKPVAKALLAKYPDTEFIIAADNDAHTTKPDGTPWNPGIEKAQQAAVAIGGARVIAPDFDDDQPETLTDWDDFARVYSDETVRAKFEELPERYDDNLERDYGMPDFPDMPASLEPLERIRPLGHNHGTYFFFPTAAGQIVSLRATDLGRMQNLYQLAPRGFWENNYSPDGKTPDSQICAFASAHLMDACHKEGVFQPENVRGVGAWIDNGRPIVNCGDVVREVNGAAKHPAEFKGQYIYESGPRVVNASPLPLSDEESIKTLNIIKRLYFKKTEYSRLLAGWLVVAPVGSVFHEHRPQIWLTGASNAGKTTVMREVVGPIIGKMGIFGDGKTTEPGIRRDIGNSGRPFIFDEAEAEKKAQRENMENILAYIRLSTSGGKIVNANGSFQARSCFCLSSIVPRVEDVADKGRITPLELLRDDRPGSSERFAILIRDIHATFTPEYSQRMLARTIKNMPALLANVETFAKVGADIFGNRRAGLQVGTMLAGEMLLRTTAQITEAEAILEINSQDWGFHTDNYEENDASKLITYIMTARIRYDHQGMGRDSTIGDLVGVSSDPHDAQWQSADKALRQYGIRVKNGMLCIANQAPQLRKLLSDTPYIPWARTLGDYPNADNLGNKAMYFMAGLTSKAIAIPVDSVLGRDVADQNEEELPFNLELFL